VASPSLFEQLERSPSGASASRRRRHAILRYLIRMSTRSTPYGLNAGVSLGGWGEETDLELADDELHARLDMGLIDSLIKHLERRAEIVTALGVRTHPLVSVRGGRAILPERFSPDRGAFEVSVRASAPVTRVLELCRARFRRFSELADDLAQEFPAAGRHQTEPLIRRLIAEGLLLTDLRPPLTGGDPVGHVMKVLEPIHAAADDRRRLAAAAAACAEWQRLCAAEGAERFADVSEAARAVAPPPPNVPPVRVDLRKLLRGDRISREVAQEAARAAELLLRITPLYDGQASLNAYRDRFLERYGSDAEVGLTELLDPDSGVGSVDLRLDEMSRPPDDRRRLLDRRLLRIAGAALRDGGRAIELDPELLAELEDVSPLSVGELPVSVEMSVLVGASSRAALDAGKFRVVVSPMMGSQGAGRILGRFAYLFDGRGEAAMRAAADRDAAAATPDRIWAELVYEPERPWLNNVMLRPATRSHEIALSGAPGVDAGRVIPIEELWVGLHHGRFYLRWPRAAAYVEVCESHMLNPKVAPAVGTFLALMRNAGRPVMTGFPWGSARELPRLPRLQSGRVVLSPAAWRPPFGEDALPTGDRQAFADGLRSWRAEWEVPRQVFAGRGDHRLLIDLQNREQVDLLRGLAESTGDDRPLVLHEALPGTDAAWLTGPNGHFLVELGVPLTRRSSLPRERGGRRPARPAGLEPPPRATRRRPPGSDWLYAKLYSSPAVAERLISGPLDALAAGALAEGVIDDWFFVRLNDPYYHLRVRFHGVPQVLTEEFSPRLSAWASEQVQRGLCRSLALDTYEREVERYGGAAGVEVAEAIFGVDSRVIAAALRMELAGAIGAERETLCVLTLDRLLCGLGLDLAARANWCSEHVSSRHDVTRDWRDHKPLLRSMLGSLERGPEQIGGRALVDLMAQFVAALEPHGRRLRSLRADGQIQWPDAGDVNASLAHMHCNRLFGPDRNVERRALGLLMRTLDSLSRAPLR
jgi:lantibiotic biosynthesis protein